MALLDVKDLSVEFRTDQGVVRAVNNISFAVEPGETMAIVGESGSGKSATALSLLRLVPEPPARVSAKHILFEDRDLATLSEAEFRTIRGNRISMIFQEPMSSLNPVLTVGLQVAEPIQLHRGVEWPEALQAARVLLGDVQITDIARRMRAYPHEFSGGMRQRVMIAMAMACQPRLIIADEPTTALDVTVQAQILTLLKDLTRTANAALILITHDLGVVARYADRVCVMYAGRIVESGTADDVYVSPRHPYTRALMNSVPRLDEDTRSRLVAIDGQPPDPQHLPVGCAFHPRCALATDRCRHEIPQLEAVSPTHTKACFNDAGT